MNNIILPKKKKDFISSNYKIALNDKILSLAAKGALSYILSKPDNYEINYNDLLSSTADEYYIIKSAVKQLISLGYLQKF